MPRFFFHVNDGAERFDPDGVELGCSDAAHSEAVSAASDMLRDVDGKHWDGSWSMRVTDENGETVSEIKVSVEKRGSACASCSGT